MYVKETSKCFFKCTKQMVSVASKYKKDKTSLGIMVNSDHILSDYKAGLKPIGDDFDNKNKLDILKQYF